MSSRYSGAWVRRGQVPPGAVLKPPTDPRHLAPQPYDTRWDPQWHQDSTVELLPEALYDNQFVQGSASGGPIDTTEWDHEDGMGVGHGLSTLEAQEFRMGWHAKDRGTYAAETFNLQPARDGQWRVDVIDDNADPDGDSPQTLVYRQPGVGSPIDPFARLGRRIWRWRDRYIDRHMWESEPHPSARRQAYVAPVQPPAPGGQNVSPFDSGTIEYAERWATPQNRVSPRPWDMPMTDNGIQGTNDYGLPSWGL